MVRREAKWVAENNPWWCTSFSLGRRAAPRVRAGLVQTGEIERVEANFDKEEGKRKAMTCQRRM